MRRNALLLAFGLSAVLASLALWGKVSSAQITKGKERPAATKHLMGGIMGPNCKGLGELLKGDGPADDEAWAKAAVQAGCLSEMSYLLMADGRCPDGVWADAATKKLRGGSAEALAAIEKKDVEATRAAFKTITSSCGACHTAHKK